MIIVVLDFSYRRWKHLSWELRLSESFASGPTFFTVQVCQCQLTKYYKQIILQLFECCLRLFGNFIKLENFWLSQISTIFVTKCDTYVTWPWHLVTLLDCHCYQAWHVVTFVTFVTKVVEIYEFFWKKTHSYQPRLQPFFSFIDSFIVFTAGTYFLKK